MQECLAVEFTLQVLQGWNLSCYQFCSLNGLLLSLVKKKITLYNIIDWTKQFPCRCLSKVVMLFDKSDKVTNVD